MLCLGCDRRQDDERGGSPAGEGGIGGGRGRGWLMRGGVGGMFGGGRWCRICEVAGVHACTRSVRGFGRALGGRGWRRAARGPRGRRTVQV